MRTAKRGLLIKKKKNAPSYPNRTHATCGRERERERERERGRSGLAWSCVRICRARLAGGAASIPSRDHLDVCVRKKQCTEPLQRARGSAVGPGVHTRFHNIPRRIFTTARGGRSLRHRPGSALRSRTRPKSLAHDTKVQLAERWGASLEQVPSVALTVGVHLYGVSRDFEARAETARERRFAGFLLLLFSQNVVFFFTRRSAPSWTRGSASCSSRPSPPEPCVSQVKSRRPFGPRRNVPPKFYYVQRRHLSRSSAP